MKKVFILLGLLVSLTVSAQWQPKPNNPYKWYHVAKDTVIKRTTINGFDVCIYQGCWQYNEFSIDTSGNLVPPVLSATVWFKEYFSGTKDAFSVDKHIDHINDYAVTFQNLPFGCEEGELGVSQLVNDFLSKKYNVPLNAITE